MKKTLVALAVLAASGASFAQATVSGIVDYGYKATTSGAGAQAAGLGVDKGRIFVTATEDIGGGFKAEAKMGFNVKGSGDAVSSRDTTLALTTPVGTLSGGRVDYGDMIDEDIATADGGNRDFAGFSLPIGPVTVGLKHVESAAGVGYGVGGAGVETATGQRFNHLLADYAAGALTVGFQYRTYDSYGLTADNNKSRTGLNVGYNFGFASVGATVQGVNHVTGTTNQAMLTLSAPLGATTLDAIWITTARNDSGTVANDGTRNGYILKAKYALSKRTAFIGEYHNYKAALADTQNSSFSVVKLSHSF